MPRLLIVVALVAALFVPRSARAELKSYYISLDTRAELTSGTYVGLPNPNYNHITLLDANIPTYDHFHSISAFAYEGDPASPTITLDHNQRVPTAAHDAPPTWIPLSLGASGGLFDGKLVATATAERLTDTTMRSVQSLDGFAPGTIENTYFTSSGGRWSQPLPDGTTFGLELVSISSGLHVGSATQLEVLTTPGEILSLGDANAVDFQPILWMEGDVSPGKYAAEFRLVDTTVGPARPPYSSSGVFGIHVEAVPEPATLVLGLLGLGAVALIGRSRKSNN